MFRLEMPKSHTRKPAGMMVLLPIYMYVFNQLKNRVKTEPKPALVDGVLTRCENPVAALWKTSRGAGKNGRGLGVKAPLYGKKRHFGRGKATVSRSGFSAVEQKTVKLRA